MEFPPPEMSMPPPSFQPSFQPRPFHPNFHHKPFYKSYKHGMVQDDFDGKRLRKSVMRKTVDYNSSIVKALEVLWRVWNACKRQTSCESSHLGFNASLMFIILFRIEFGNETNATDELCSPRIATCPTSCRRPVIWKTPATLSPHDSWKLQQTRWDVPFLR